MYLQAAALDVCTHIDMASLHFETRFSSLPISAAPSYVRSLWWRSFGHIVAELLIPVAIKKVEKKISLFGSWGHATTIQPFWDH
jgi:hypothetical protein